MYLAEYNSLNNGYIEGSSMMLSVGEWISEFQIRGPTPRVWPNPRLGRPDLAPRVWPPVGELCSGYQVRGPERKVRPPGLAPRIWPPVGEWFSGFQIRGPDPWGPQPWGSTSWGPMRVCEFPFKYSLGTSSPKLYLNWI